MALRDDITDRARSRIGLVLKGKWRLDEVVGIGGMATVYSATHRNQKRVAIKMLHTELALDEEVTIRFLREGYAANAVGHTGAVSVLDDDVSEDGAAFLVMELLEGETVEARWERRGQRLEPEHALSIVDQLLDVLIVAHQRGIVHRDLKPENLFVTFDGQLKVLDFGIARLRELPKDAASTTRAGSLLGTPAFMAPEQALARWDEVDGRTDIWAVGAILFTLLTGRYVHDGETVNEQLILAATTRAQPIGELLPELSPEVCQLIDKALAFKPIDRFADARSMRAALRAAGNDLAGPMTLPAPSIQRSAPAATLAAPPEVTAAITGSRAPTTARPLSISASYGRAQRRRRTGLWIGLSSALALVAGVGITLAVVGGDKTPNPQPTLGAESAPIAAPTTPHSAAPLPHVEPAPRAKDSGAIEATKPPKPVAKPVVAGKPRVTPPKPVSETTPKPPVTGKPNPFDIRH